MRIVILGAGAIGSLFGGFLAGKHDVTLVCRQDHALAIQKEGLKITGLSDFHVRPKAVTSVEGLEPPEILFLTVKAYDTEKALEDARAIMSPETILVSLQNGLGNLEIISKKMPDARFVVGITSQGAILRAPGNVEHTGQSYTIVGGSTDAVKVAELLNDSDIETTVSNDIQAEIWYKAIVNAVINPLGTLLKGRNGLILERPELQKLVKRIIQEGVDVALARHISIDPSMALSKVMQVATETANNICSMRLDVEKSRRTEIMQMNGAIASYGKEAGISTPVNSLLTSLVRALEPI